MGLSDPTKILEAAVLAVVVVDLDVTVGVDAEGCGHVQGAFTPARETVDLEIGDAEEVKSIARRMVVPNTWVVFTFSPRANKQFIGYIGLEACGIPGQFARRELRRCLLCSRRSIARRNRR